MRDCTPFVLHLLDPGVFSSNIFIHHIQFASYWGTKPFSNSEGKLRLHFYETNGALCQEHAALLKTTPSYAPNTESSPPKTTRYKYAYNCIVVVIIFSSELLRRNLVLLELIEKS
uniref:Uncharacterized protein n=1 Tax=Strigamia maritima TaxID=126957 RepID=T1JIU0_STRMM